MDRDMPALELRELSKTYGRGDAARQAVSNVSLTVRRGEVYGFLGPNGAGKSTTIRMALRLIRPSSGHVLLFGKDVAAKGALARVGSLADGGSFYPFLSARDNLRVLARMHGIDGHRIEPLLERLDLSRDAKRKVKDYSLGMKQRLGVAAALIHDPDLIILDEPTNGLDAAGIQDMRTLVRDLAQKGKAVFLSSHLLHEVEQICDRLAIVANGRLLREASIAEMLDQGNILRIEAQPQEAAMRAIGTRWTAAQNDDAIKVYASRADAPAILRCLVEAGVDIFAIGPDEQSLEEIFLEMTKEAHV